MRRIRLILEYDGTDYVGWQTQPNGVAVQAVVERALQAVTGETLALHGSGARTAACTRARRWRISTPRRACRPTSLPLRSTRTCRATSACS